MQLKKANVYRSIPYSRLGSNRDAHCYRKAFPHLVAFKVSANVAMSVRSPTAFVLPANLICLNLVCGKMFLSFERRH